jgi:hypothetical protein
MERIFAASLGIDIERVVEAERENLATERPERVAHRLDGFVSFRGSCGYWS